jgi:hypothetical protein
MGAVYLASDPALERNVALKVMLPQYSADPRAREQFLREARAAAKVKNDHVVTIFDVGEADGIPFIAMEYLRGAPLDRFLRQHGELPLGRSLRVCRETAIGLSAAHALGLVHRDVKPGNIWLEAPTDRVKILDFGLARPAPGSPGPGQTSTRAVEGTPAYMSPEQARSRPTDSRSALFSLGVVLYELATGRKPFTGASAFDVMAAVVSLDPPLAHDVNPGVPAALSDLIRRLLAKAPADRPPSAAAVAEELAAIERDVTAPSVRPILVTPPFDGSGPWADLATTELVEEGDAGDSAAVPVHRSAGGAPRWLWPAVGGVLVAAAVLTCVGIAALNRKSGSPPPNSEQTAAPGQVPPGPKAQVQPPKPEPVRQAAETLLTNGVRVEVRPPGAGAFVVPPEGRLPDGPFEVTAVILPPERRRADEFASKVLTPALAALPSLTAVVDEGHTVKWTEAEIVRLTEAPFAPRLTTLLSEFELTRTTAPALARLPALTHLRCGAGLAEDEALVALARARGCSR